MPLRSSERSNGSQKLRQKEWFPPFAGEQNCFDARPTTRLGAIVALAVALIGTIIGGLVMVGAGRTTRSRKGRRENRHDADPQTKVWPIAAASAASAGVSVSWWRVRGAGVAPR
jgi:hypothetical protein